MSRERGSKPAEPEPPASPSAPSDLLRAAGLTEAEAAVARQRAEARGVKPAELVDEVLGERVGPARLNPPTPHLQELPAPSFGSEPSVNVDQEAAQHVAETQFAAEAREPAANIEGSL